MKNNCQCCDNQQSSGFAFGLICGAVIGAIIAVYIYKNSKTDVFTNLRKKFEQFFNPDTSSKKSKPKKPVILPPSLVIPTPPSVVKTKAKKFLKS